MDRIVVRTLPNGKVGKLSPYHVCLKGLEQAVLCRDEEDYDALIKVLCVSARRKNVIIIIYGAVSNHCHIATLAVSIEDADAFARDIKKVYSMWMKNKYGERNILRRIEIKSLYLDTDWYARNVLAYIPKNALDNGCKIHEYRWSGYRAMFAGELGPGLTTVSGLNRRECKRIMHTGDKLNDVPWLLNERGELEPKSFCDYRYLEQAFNHDPAFFLKTIGGQDSSELRYRLEVKPYLRITDEELLAIANETCQRWFGALPAAISIERKTRVATYLLHTHKTSINQLARVLQIPRGLLSRIQRR